MTMSQDTTLHGPAPAATPGALAARVRAMAGRRVLVVGDIMLDRYVRGQVHRLSPESVAPVLSVDSHTAMPGGAGNVAANLAGLGLETFVLAVTGQDQAANEVRAHLTALNIAAAHLVTAHDRPTTVKTRFMAGPQHLLRVDEESTAALDETTAGLLIARATALIEQADIVILSDYNKGVLTPTVISRIIAAAQAKGCPVLVDPKKKDYGVYRGASVITPNRKELQDATGVDTATDEQITRAGTMLIDRCGIGAVVATRSQDGLSLLQSGKNPLHLRAQALEVFDVSGAGDTVIATFAAALAAGADHTDAAHLANRAAALAVARSGTAPVRQDELLAALAKDAADKTVTQKTSSPMTDTTENLTADPWAEAAAIVARWKALGQRVGFTNGCFDILHPGHVSYLAQARARCDRLVVGLNADASVTRLKGPERPVNDQDSRAAVLTALAAVDLVVLFGATPEEGDKPLRLIKRLKPDLYVKGGDYTEDQLPEAPLVRAYGGTVAIMPLCEGHSTTGTIKKMKNHAA